MFRTMLLTLTVATLSACASGLPAAAARDAAALAASAAGPKLTFVANQAYQKALDAELARPGLKSVDVLQFNFFADRPGAIKQTADKLVALAKQGVAIRVFLEGTREEVKARHQATIALLSAAGIPVRLSKDHIVHAKAVCFDGRRLLMGSTNWTVTSWSKNNESNALIDSVAIARGFGAFFERLWTGHETMTASETTDGDTALYTDTAFFDQALAVIGRAEKTLDVGTYFLALRKGREATGDAKVKQLLDAIVARKDALAKDGKPLAVRLFLDNNGIRPELHQSHTLDSAANARDYLVARGVTEVWFDRFEQISHCKYILRDAGTPRGEVIFGSTNLYVGDFDRHHQLNIRTTDAGMVKAFAGYHADRLGESAKAIREPARPAFDLSVETMEN